MTRHNAQRAALAWWRDMGLHTLVADAPRPWFEAEPPPARVAAPAPAALARPRAPARPQPPVGADPTTATDPAELLALARAHAGTTALLHDGALAGPMFLVPAPEEGDARAGRLLAGREGALLDAMLAAIGLSRATATVASAALTLAANPADFAFAAALIDLLEPPFVVAMGAAPSSRLTGDTGGLIRVRGQWKKSSACRNQCHVMTTFDPAHLLAHPAHKAHAWADLRALTQVPA